MLSLPLAKNHQTLVHFLPPTPVTKEGLTNMKAEVKDDLEDIPMAYLWYVLLAIVAIAAVAVVLIIRLF
jgi:hypothetical protein